MSKVGEQIRELIEKEAPAYGLFLVSDKFAPGGILLQYFLDSEEDMNMKAMTGFARHINRLTEEMDLGERKFMLEISSPGATKALSDLRQLKKHIGKTLIFLHNEVEKEGEFKSLVGETIEIEKKIFRTPNSRKFTTELENVEWGDIKDLKIKLKY
jgi:ribosome maturation factor RimP